MTTNQTSSNSLHPPVIAGASRVGRVGGFLLPMEHQELIERLADIFQSQADIEALASLIHERSAHLGYRAIERELYFGIKPETQTAKTNDLRAET